MKLTSQAARRIAAAAITCTAILLPAAALASPGPAAAVGLPAARPRPIHPVTVYVVNSGGPLISDPGTVTPIPTRTNTAGKAIKVGLGPRAIAITPNGKTAYVSNSGSDTVTPISTATGKAGRAIKVGKDPGAIAITPDGQTAYVAISGDVLGGPGLVAPIQTATNTAGQAITVGKDPGAIAITSNGKTAYVADEDYANGPPTVTPINTATNKADKTITLGECCEYPGDIAITPNGKTAYIVSANYSGAATRETVTPIRTATSTALKAITVGGSAPARSRSPRNDQTAGPGTRAARAAGQAIPACSPPG